MFSFPTKRLVFRADGNATIGLGHLVRLLALADMLRGLAPGVFVVRDPTPAVGQLITEAGWALLVGRVKFWPATSCTPPTYYCSMATNLTRPTSSACASAAAAWCTSTTCAPGP
jgi:hypothetical protein